MKRAIKIVIKTILILSTVIFMAFIGTLVYAFVSLPMTGYHAHDIDNFSLFYMDRLYPKKGESNLNKLRALSPTLIEWQLRAETIHDGILKGAQLDPLPQKTAFNAVMHSTRTYTNYSVSNYYFECIPGFYVTGNLYSPLNLTITDRVPALLIPHGHFELGRFDPDVQQLAITCARMGAIAITYDMIGYGDSQQVEEHEVPHAFMIQLLDSIRVVDYVTSLLNVDPNRIACTGASGGGTQTFFLVAVDSRVNVSIPCVMVCSSYSGDENCEDGMPVHRGANYATNNAEIAALAAPRPMLIISDGQDWTYATPTREYPFIRDIYDLFNSIIPNSRELVKNAHFSNEGHDYGPNKRQAAYSFLAQYLNLSISPLYNSNEMVDETPNVIEDTNLMHSFNDAYPRPDNALFGDNIIYQAIIDLEL